MNFWLVKETKRIETKLSGFKIDGVSDRLFINEHLTPMNKILYKNARVAAEQNQFKCVWVQSGNILVRKDDTTKILQISSEQNLNKIKDRETSASCKKDGGGVFIAIKNTLDAKQVVDLQSDAEEKLEKLNHYCVAFTSLLGIQMQAQVSPQSFVKLMIKLKIRSY
ncbi:hypothetical protein HHI36_010822 [Cryptolaemus montrouzieri]|uniref:FP protein C-terminal domain-containing protein n=1 Tax=Cryptolaemus montrouzieri TaxID=559131 RepID=A0ABD2MK00_9CUCU